MYIRYMQVIKILQKTTLDKLTENMDSHSNPATLLNLVHIYSLAHPQKDIRKKAGEMESKIMQLIQKKNSTPILDLGKERVEFVNNLKEVIVKVGNKEIPGQSEEAYQTLITHTDEKIRKQIFEAMNYQSENCL